MIEQQLGPSTHNPNHMSADDVQNRHQFVYHSHPDIFQEVLAGTARHHEIYQQPCGSSCLGNCS